MRARRRRSAFHEHDGHDDDDEHPMSTTNFADRLAEACRAKDSVVCVGIDPRVRLLPSEFRAKRDTPKHNAEAVAAWMRELITVIAPLAPVVKPQIAFFEVMGAPGYRIYHETVIAAREAGLLVIGDVKRGDIGSTAEAYAEGQFDVIGVDAVTVNPYLGRDSIDPWLPYCRTQGKGIFVLVKTSNPGSSDLQDLWAGDGPLHQSVGRIVRELGADASMVGTCGLSAVGAVTGATFPEEVDRLRALMPDTNFLVPGYGAQGATAADCARALRRDGLGAIVNSSRGLTFAFRSGSHKERFGDAKWRESVAEAVREMTVALRTAGAAAVRTA